ncbi:MAG: ABC-F family ATP-binding cassette domain-containing protein [Deltaproteobacteria bacterium]|nr:ABC-F family ATP-binding cassette domain-containing protein [Deltaproteobacteria bacterium]
MSILLTVKDLGKTFDSRPLFSKLNFGIETGERIGLIGPNGAGKSTLLKIISHKIVPDDGELVFQRGTRVAHLEQTPTFSKGATVRSTLLEGAKDPDGWEALVKVDELIWQLEFEKANISPDDLVDSLSGGWKKRLSLARELMREPDLLLLDEPTNHLDVESILWLENLISKAPYSVVTITHDRLFLQRVSNRILELDRRNLGGLLSIKGNYSQYLETKESMMEAQENREAILKGNLRRETEWLRAGAKARTTKQQARITRHAVLSAEVSELSARNVNKIAQIDFQSSENAPKRLIETKKISKSYSPDRPLFLNLDLLITPGTRIGILGTNGCGKSTLIRVLLDLEKADSGKVFRSDQLKVSYFEQNRDTLDPEVSLMRTVCPYGDQVIYRGRPTHIRSYLDRFLFSQNQMELPVGSLSGGEQSRVLIAKLMLDEANLLVLDEPTNDLDIATLNVLQDCLTQFEGAILLVSHDRYFLDQVSTEIIAFPMMEADRKLGKIHSFADLAQWENWHAEVKKEEAAKLKSKKLEASSNSQTQPIKSSSPKNSKEFEAITKKIEKLEASLAKLEAECGLPENSSDIKKLAELGQKMQKLQSEIAELYQKLELSLEA